MKQETNQPQKEKNHYKSCDFSNNPFFIDTMTQGSNKYKTSVYIKFNK